MTLRKLNNKFGNFEGLLKSQEIQHMTKEWQQEVKLQKKKATNLWRTPSYTMGDSELSKAHLSPSRSLVSRVDDEKGVQVCTLQLAKKTHPV
ncbi:UBAP1-MVB12-associated (UMA)-domain containing protein 1 isoform X2 [Panthera onca]|uniref:UBAP1-MVB12-associated (UMA)-domain containing protein 1 isoform X2 n=1 Tax=Panthera onca TaxID=9690 RepID=UPI002954B3EA|nr:UBAP1-MVB12-associated (UMA)-domain containing protein 1 isoform X2 [Panthera onca]